MPHKSFAVRDYHKAVTSAKVSLARTTRVPKLTFFKKYDIQVHMDMKPLTPSPTGKSQLNVILAVCISTASRLIFSKLCNVTRTMLTHEGLKYLPVCMSPKCNKTRQCKITG